MSIANEMEHLKMDIWTVLDLRGVILDRASSDSMVYLFIKAIQAWHPSESPGSLPRPGPAPDRQIGANAQAGVDAPEKLKYSAVWGMSWPNGQGIGLAIVWSPVRTSNPTPAR